MTGTQLDQGEHTSVFETKPLSTQDITQAVALDAHWFGNDGVQEQDLAPLTNNSDRALALFEGITFRGFATFEVEEPGAMPTNYTGIPLQEKALFIQQFTTDQNYSGNMETDKRLLEAVEAKAKVLSCAVVAEALDINHAFSKERSLAERGEKHDAFGFYEQQGYTTDRNNIWTWQAEGISPVECLLYTKKTVY